MIQNNILRLLQRADNDNAIYTAEITDFDKFVIAMMYSLPPVPSKELKKILSYIAHTVTITASIKRLENFSYIYHDDTQKEDTYYTFSHATTRVLSSKWTKATRPLITNHATNKLKAGLLLEQIQIILKSMILTKWQALKDIEKEDMLSSLYIKNGPFSNFLKANEDRRKKILSDIMCEENYNELLKAKNYNDKLLKSYSTSYKEMKLSKDDDYVVFKNRINSLITQKSNVITDILIELLDSNDIKDIYIGGMQGKWIVSRCRRDYLYADKDNEKLKLMSQYDLNKDKIVSNSQTLSRLSNIDKIEEKAKLQNEIIRAQEQNVKLSEHIHCSTLSQLESNNIYISIFNDKLISFYFLNTRNTIIPQKELKKKLDLCENFAQEMQRNAIIRIFCNSESDVKILQSQYNKINGKSFNPLVPTKVLIVAKPEVKLKNEAVKALIGGWKLCGIF